MTEGLRRNLLRTVAWNCLLTVALAMLVATAGEVFLRIRTPFLYSVWPARSIVPRVGELYDANEAIRYTNNLDFWVVSRTNSLGFIAREPPSPAVATTACHVALIGDSFVEAKEVPIAEKLEVQVEELASEQLPGLRITTSAFGYSGTGQIQQLAYYDEYVRHLRPKLVVLIFVANDFMNNYPLFQALSTRAHPKHPRSVSTERSPNGQLKLRPPSPEYRRYSRGLTRVGQAAQFSYFGWWLVSKSSLQLRRGQPSMATRVAQLVEDESGYTDLLADWAPIPLVVIANTFGEDSLPELFFDALEYTSFALEEFKARTERDGAELVLLASHSVRYRRMGEGRTDGGGKLFPRMSEMAAAVNVPVVDQTDYVLRQGAAVSDLQWPHDDHWNAAGHRWAAEALIEYIGGRPEICDPEPPAAH